MKEKIKPYEGIHVVHMLKTIAKSWWKMLIAMVILAVALGGYSYYLNAEGLKAQANEAKANAEDATEAGAAEESQYESEEEILLNSGLSEKAQDEVLYYTNKIYYFQTQYERERSYVENSLLMQLDPNEIWTTTLYYDFLNQENARAAIASYISKVASKETYDLAAEKLNLHKDSKYLEELITCNAVSDVDINVYAIQTEQSVSGDDLKIVIRYGTKEGCETIASVVKEAVEQERISQVSKDPAKQIELMGEQLEQKTDATLLAEQKSEISDLCSIADNIVNARTNLENNEEAVSQALLDFFRQRDKETEDFSATAGGMDEETISDISEEKENSDVTDVSETTQITRKPKASKKYIALGLFLGIFLVGAFEALRYFFSDSLKQAEELEEAYQLETMDGNRGAMMATILAEKCKKKAYRRIYLTSSHGEKQEKLQQIADAVNVQLAQDQKVTFVYSDNKLTEDEKEPKKLADADALLLVETCGKSKHKEIAQILQLAAALDKDVCGAVVY